MNKKTKEEKEMKRPDAELAERFGVRPQMAHGEMEAADCDHLAALKFSHAPVYAFTEQGVAMLATVLKSAVGEEDGRGRSAHLQESRQTDGFGNREVQSPVQGTDGLVFR